MLNEKTRDPDFEAFAEENQNRWSQDDEPLPLRRQIAPPQPFPIAHLGALLGPVAALLQKIVQAPDALCAQSVLAAAFLAAQSHRNVLIDGRTYPISEYFITIGESGERKSAVDRIANEAARDESKRLRQEHESQLQNYEREFEIYKTEKERILRDKKNASLSAGERQKKLEELGSPPSLPLSPIIIIEEPTYEGLIKLLMVGQPSSGLFSDEGGRLLGGHSMSKDNQLKTIAGLSELWDNKPITRVRVEDGASVIVGKRLSMHIMIQPVVAQQILGNSMLLGQGFLARSLISWPSSNIGHRRYKEIDWTREPLLHTYHGRLLDLFQMPKPTRSDKPNELEPKPLELSKDAKRLWIGFYNDIESQLRDGGKYASLRGLGAKIPEHALRIAGCLSIVEKIEPSVISDIMMDCGVTLAQYYLDEAMRITHESESDPDLKLAEQVLAWLQSLPSSLVHLAQIYQRGPNPVRDAKTAQRVMRILEDHGYIFSAKPMVLDGSKRKNVWTVRK